ncbi:YbjN domain-containing protein [Corynebacterium argentoratense]|uniref:YbjN domain-containing protein n=1 Tax=Corynebacterium argentoratense TaxID=42817 RepID=UPI001F26DC54|nr:YbjN domain-containing protein [Corynebacterium argentoratense]MCF1766371.1 YbjN domain-containing protein [Corynebacterium argentoratense]
MSSNTLDPALAVTVERVQKLAAVHNFEGTIAEDGELGFAFNNLALWCSVKDDVLCFYGLWRGLIDEEHYTDAQMRANKLNVDRLIPTTSLVDNEGKRFMMTLTVPVDAGLDERQLFAVFAAAIQSIGETVTILEQAYPELVTWEEK